MANPMKNTRSKESRDKRKKDLNSSVQKVSSIMTGPESRAFEDYVFNMFEAEKPMQLCRPIPVRSTACHYNGQIKFNTNKEYVEVRIRPDPRAFLEITTQIGVAATAESIPQEEIGALYSAAGSVGTIYKYINIQEPILLTDGTYVRGTFAECDNAAGEQLVFINGQVVPYAYGFPGVGLAAGAKIGMTVVNNGPAGAEINCSVIKVNTATRAATLIATAGANVACAANGSATSTFTAAAPLTLLDTEILCICAGLKAVAGTVQYRNFTLHITELSGLTVNDVHTTTPYTLGEAVYGIGDAKAVVLDQFFRDSLLWAPVGLSARLNVNQVLKDAGGVMLSSYLPSYTFTQTSNDPSQTWQDIVAYGKTYPVRDDLPFRTGAHASWVGARIQDYEFRKPFTQNSFVVREADSMPCLCIIAQKASDTEIAKFLFDFQVNFEVQTLNPLVVGVLGPSSPDFLCQFLALVQGNSKLVGENPLHLERIRKVVKRIVSDPRFRQAGKWALKNGLPLLMSVM